ncbi:MAG: KOW domain-containing RNA-binding protein [Clostridia bacterium]|nr:KOW domain-containing RNA-binding protein [Clostridia bacterium]
MQRGDVVKSLKGRDAGSIYAVILIKDGIAYLANGRNRTVENPKKKNVKHLEVLASVQDFVAKDTDIRKYCKI